MWAYITCVLTVHAEQIDLLRHFFHPDIGCHSGLALVGFFVCGWELAEAAAQLTLSLVASLSRFTLPRASRLRQRAFDGSHQLTVISEIMLQTYSMLSNYNGTHSHPSESLQVKNPSIRHRVFPRV